MTNYQQTVTVLLAALSAVLYIAAMPTESAKINIGSNYTRVPAISDMWVLDCGCPCYGGGFFMPLNRSGKAGIGLLA